MNRSIVIAVLWRLAVVGALIIALAAVPSPTENPEKDLRIRDADVKVEVLDDGALEIRERLGYEFTGTYQGAYRDVPLAKGARATAAVVAENGEALERGGNTTLGSFDDPGRYGVERISFFDADGEPQEGLRLVWHYRATDEERTFELVYRVERAVTAYDDVIDVGWVVWGDQWEFWLDRLEAEIVAPGSEPIEAWVRPRSLGADPTLGDAAAVEVERVPQGEAVTLRAVYPRQALANASGARIVKGDGLERIRAEEAALDDNLLARTKLRNAIAEAATPLSLIWTVIILGLTTALYVGARERRTETPRYLSEPPEDVPPALAYALATEGSYDERVVVATLLDLVDRGYYEADVGSGDELDLELSVADERPPSDVLLPYETDTLDFFDRLLGSDTVAFSKLKDKAPKHSSSWHSRWTDLNEALDQAEQGQLEWDRDNTRWRRLLAVVAFLGYLAIAAAYFSRTFQLGVPFVAAVFGLLFMYALPKLWLKRLDPEARERNARWAAFQRWTDDFPSLDDDPPATLKLWRSILVYAVAFGTAERIARSGRIPEPVLADNSSAWTYAALHQGSITSDFNGFSSGFSSQVAPQSSSGGGFSGGGGGGGFSGGGGGGGW